MGFYIKNHTSAHMEGGGGAGVPYNENFSTICPQTPIDAVLPFAMNKHCFSTGTHLDKK